TASVLSKEYLYGIVGERATVRWEPFPVIPISDHAPDFATVTALMATVSKTDPDFVFTNLGDVDRLGHADLTGTTLRAARTAALRATVPKTDPGVAFTNLGDVDRLGHADLTRTTLRAARTAAPRSTDTQLARFVAFLKRTHRWDTSVLLVLADHSMDWSMTHRVISLTPVLEADPFLAGRVAIAQNGGADLLTFTGADSERVDAVDRMRELVRGVDGVLSVHTPDELRLGPRAGDLVAYCRAGWRFTDPKPWSNPIPGNHGHPATEPIPFFVSGGHPT